MTSQSVKKLSCTDKQFHIMVNIIINTDVIYTKNGEEHYIKMIGNNFVKVNKI